MAGISQTVLVGAEAIAGYRGNLATSQSLVFGKNAGSTLNPGDTSLMSSMNISGLGIYSGPMTIEYWVKHTNTQFDEGIVHLNGQAILGGINFLGAPVVIHQATSVNLNNYLITNAAMTIPSGAIPSQTWQQNDWYHVAIVKSATSNVTAWVNGYQSPSGQIYSPVNYAYAFSILGSWRNNLGLGTTNNLIGNLYNLSLSPGASLYDVNSATIVVPKLSLGLNVNSDMLLLARANQTFVDTAGKATLSVRAGVVESSDSTPFHDPMTKSSNTAVRNSRSSPYVTNGSGSYYFNGKTTSFGTYAGSSRFAFDSGDFTVEWFSYAQYNTRPTPGIFWYETSGTTDLGLSFQDTGLGTVNVLVKNGSNTFTLGGISDSLFYRQWIHWAIVRISGQIYCYYNGNVLNPSGNAFAYTISSSSGTVYIGKQGTTAATNDCFYGYITNLRAVKGLGIYTGNFTRPTANLQRFQFANPYGGSNTAAFRTDQTAVLMVP